MKTSTANLFSFSSKVQKAFTQGDCWLLATTLNTMEGFPVVTSNWTEPDNNFFWSHAANRLPDGRIVDIEGIWTEDEWIFRWHAKTTPFYITKDEMVMSAQDWTRKDWDEEVIYCDFYADDSEISANVETYAKEITALLPKKALKTTSRKSFRSFAKKLSLS